MKNLPLLFSCVFLTLILINCKGEKENVKESTVTLPNDHFLFLSDIHLNSINSVDATTYGEDTKTILWEKAKTKIKEVIKDNSPKFIIYTGDLPDHNPDKDTKSDSSHSKNIKTMLEELADIANGLPLFYTPGNNDALAGDYYAFSFCDGRNALSLDTSDHYPAPNASQLYDIDSIHGYYSAKPFDGLRVISLNSVLLGHTYHSNHCGSSSLEPETQLEAGNTQITWFKHQLKEADSLNEKIYIIMHIPPGLDAYKTHEYDSNYLMWGHKHWTKNFLSSIQQYSHTVSGIFYGHTHMDELRLLSDTNGNYSNVALSCPGITPKSDNNPGFKLVSYNTNYEPTGYTTYFTPLPCSTWGNSSYTFNDSYQRSDTSTSTIKDWILNLDTTQLKNNMKVNYMVKSPSNSPVWSKLGIWVNY